MRFQVGSTPQPSGETMPRPVTTTRLISSTPALYIHRPQQEAGGPQKRSVRLRRDYARPSAFRVLLEEFCGVAYGQDRFGGIVRNFTTEFFFKCHHEFDRIQTVGAEIINEACVVDHFLGVNTK